jgi:hypothetical protein
MVFTPVVFMALIFIMATSIMATSMATGSSRGGASLHSSMVRMPTRTPTRRTPIRILIMPGMRRLITDRIGLLSQLWHQSDHAPVLLVDLSDKDRATASFRGCFPSRQFKSDMPEFGLAFGTYGEPAPLKYPKHGQVLC